MFYFSILNQVILVVYLLICPFISPHSYQNKHSSLQVISQPDISKEVKRLLKRYGTLHTMREYIYWAIKEEHVYLNLHKIINCLLLERKLIKTHLQRITIQSSNRQTSITSRSIRFLGYYGNPTTGECNDFKGIIKLIHMNYFIVL